MGEEAESEAIPEAEETGFMNDKHRVRGEREEGVGREEMTWGSFGVTQPELQLTEVCDQSHSSDPPSPSEAGNGQDSQG